MNYSDPPAMMWFRIYCGVLIALYLLVAVAGVFGVAYAPQIATPENPEAEIRLMSIAFIPLGLVLAAAFTVPFFVQRRRWVWIYDIVLIAIGLSSCCTLVPCIFLLIAWLKPEVQQRFP